MISHHRIRSRYTLVATARASSIPETKFLAAFAAVPSDRSSGLGHSTRPVERVLGGLPTPNYGEIVIPGLALDLQRCSAPVIWACCAGRARRSRDQHPWALLVLGLDCQAPGGPESRLSTR